MYYFSRKIKEWNGKEKRKKEKERNAHRTRSRDGRSKNQKSKRKKQKAKIKSNKKCVKKVQRAILPNTSGCLGRTTTVKSIQAPER